MKPKYEIIITLPIQIGVECEKLSDGSEAWNVVVEEKALPCLNEKSARQAARLFVDAATLTLWGVS